LIGESHTNGEGLTWGNDCFKMSSGFRAQHFGVDPVEMPVDDGIINAIFDIWNNIGRTK
jgi:hypothetical protein